MTKLIVLAAFGVAGLVSAKDNVEKGNSKGQAITSKKESVLKKGRKAKAALAVRCGIVQATCTSAYTCQDWSDAEFTEWAEQIQNNYCQL